MKRVIEAIGNNNITLKKFVRNRKAQQWFFDPTSKTVRNNNWKNYCAEVPGNGGQNNFKITSSITSRWWQMFRMKGAFITNEHGKVVDVSGGKDNENQNIIVWNKHGGVNQQFDIVYVDEWPAEPKKGDLNPDFGLYIERPFLIQTAMNSRRYLDLDNSYKMMIKARFQSRTSQVWWFDQKTKTIKSKRYGNKSFNIVSQGRARDMQVYNTNSQWYQIFKYQNKQFLNAQNGKALDVSGGKDIEGQQVIVWKRHNGQNQKWNVVYLDTIKEEKIGNKGFDKDAGLYINRPFYIVTRMPSKRVVESMSGNVLRLKQWSRNRKNQQQFFYSSEDRSIRS